MPDHPARPALWMLCGALAFAMMGALTHALGPRCDWLLIALVRALFMFVSAVAMARLRGARLAVWAPPTLWVRSLAGSLSLVCNFYAMTRLPIADVLTLTNTYPLWIVLMSAAWLGGRPSWGEIVGVLSGLAGVALVQRPHLGGDHLATAIALGSSVSTAVAMLGLHRLRGVDPRAIVAHFAAVGSLVAGTWLALRGTTDLSRGAEPLTLLMLLGVGVSGTIGQLFLTRAYAAGPPGEVSIVGLSQVVFAMGFDVVLWGRHLTPWTLAGFALVLGPSALLAGRAARRVAPASRPGPA
jgi:drug/metabolite transporter (DMT)-like permease